MKEKRSVRREQSHVPMQMLYPLWETLMHFRQQNVAEF
jgi:hypothetical protein